MTMNSMTGFGRARDEISDRFGASVVIRTVNHRYLDIQIRTNLREDLPEAEAAVRSVISKQMARGRVSVNMTLERKTPAQSRVIVDADAVRDVLSELGELDSSASGTVTVGDVLGLPGVVTVLTDETLLDVAELDGLARVTEKALNEVLSMRVQEGAHLEQQIENELSSIEQFADWVEPRLEELRLETLGRLRERIGVLLEDEDRLDEGRLEQEAAVLADRSDVAEELVRLRGHIDHFRAKMKKSGVVGRSLDFLCQEIHRELNTLGSKCRDKEVAHRLVDTRTATERVREQVQNIE